MTNLIRQPDRFTRWVRGGINKTMTEGIDYGGDPLATTIYEDDQFSYHYIAESFTNYEAGTYQFTVWAKDTSDGRSKLRLLSRRPETYDVSSSFDLDAGINIETGLALLTLGGGWYQCDVSAELDSSTLFNVMIMLVDSNGNYDYLGDGESGISLYLPEFTKI